MAGDAAPRLSDGANSSALNVTSLPAEIIHQILQWLPPTDLFAASKTCRRLYASIDKNPTLFRQVYLQTLDAPKEADLDWEGEIRNLLRLQAICKSSDEAAKKDKLGFVHDTVTRLLEHASPSGGRTNAWSSHSTSRNAELLEQLFGDDANSAAFLQRSFLFERVRNEHHHHYVRFEAGRAREHQQSAKLHCLYGRPILNVGRLRSNKTYPYACAKVYDLRQYTDQNQWGPFLNDGSGTPDWEKLEAIFVVLGHNMNSKRLVAKAFSDIWDSPFSGSWPRSFISKDTAEPSALDLEDPYGITGTWYRVVCFLDYNDFFAFNFPMGDLVPEDAPRPALNIGEAIRLLVVKVAVTEILPPGPDDGQELPVVHFRGISRSMDGAWDDNANSELRGIVRLTKSGDVRWTTWSLFHGQERWRSESIQIGGVKSARGVFGTWFDSEFDPHGPAGPTALWKASDSQDAQTRLHDMQPSDFFITYSTLLGMDDSDPDAELEFVMYDEDEDDDDEPTGLGDQIASELPGLLQDAQMDVTQLGPAHGHEDE